MKKKSFSQILFDIFNVCFMLFMVVVCVYPMIYVLFASLSDANELMIHSGLLFKPLKPNISAYQAVFKNRMILKGYMNTIYILVVGVSLNLVLTSMGAYFMSRKNVFFQKPITMYILFTMYFSGGLIPFYLTVRGLGMYNSLLALIIPTAINTFNMLIMRTSFANIPDSLIEAAKIDGASEITVLAKVVLPLSKTIIAVMILYYGVAHWKGATLSREGESIKLRFVSSDPEAKLEVLEAAPLPTSPNPEGQKVNRAFKRIAIKFAGSDKVTLTVQLESMSSYDGAPIDNSDIKDWAIPDGELTEGAKRMKIDKLIIDGVERQTPSTYNYYDGDPIPELTDVIPENPKSRTEFEYFSNDVMEGYQIRVYAPDESYYTSYIMPLIKLKKPDDVLGHTRYPIRNMEVSHEPEAHNHRWNVMDEDSGTRWTTYTIGAYGIADLGEVKEIDAIALSFWKGSERVYKYELYCSADGVDYIKMADISTSGKTEGYELNEFGTYYARYIKFVNKGNSANDNSNITELAILKRKCDTCSENK